MSLKLKIKVEENRNEFYFFEMTGSYDEKCNPGGWGYPNKKLKFATEAKLHVYQPKSTVPVIIDLFNTNTFPTDKNLGYEVMPVDIGAKKMVSGIWRFDYYVKTFDNNGETLHAVSCQKLFIKDVKCCIDKKTLSVSTDNFKSKEVAESNALHGLVESAKKNACQGNIKEAQEIVDYLYSKCNCNC